jgi:hypothetical protein
MPIDIWSIWRTKPRLRELTSRKEPPSVMEDVVIVAVKPTADFMCARERSY